MTPSAEETKSYAGCFQLPSGGSYQGRLTIDGPETRLRLWSAERFRLVPGSLDAVAGVIDKGKRVSLFDCLVVGESSFPLTHSQMSHQVDLFPHHVVAGYTGMGPTEESVAAVSFSVPDAEPLFPARRTMTTLRSSRELLEEVLRLHSEADRELDIGDSPEILIHAGWKQIFSVDTSLGTVSANHRWKQSTSMVRGSSLQNAVSARIDFAKAVSAKAAISRAARVSRFFELIIGRPQRPIEVSLEVEKREGGRPETMDVYHTAIYVLHPSVRQSGSIAVLIDPITEAREFADVLRRWIDRESTWENARVQFSKVWQKGYDENRATRAANVFDLIPEDVFPEAPPVPKDVVEARDSARELFAEASRSPERDMVLGALGRVGKWTLKQRIRERSRLLADRIGERIPKIDEVTDAAVDWRNELVHGTRAHVDGAEHVLFLTDTLEFVFAASDLVEAGWDIVRWWEAGHRGSHPFFDYLWNYEENLKHLQDRSGYAG